jgi:hypothetical protein
MSRRNEVTGQEVVGIGAGEADSKRPWLAFSSYRDIRDTQLVILEHRIEQLLDAYFF